MEPMIEKKDFSFTQPLAVSHFTYPQSHLLAQVCLLVVGQVTKASVCHVLRLTGEAL